MLIMKTELAVLRITVFVWGALVILGFILFWIAFVAFVTTGPWDVLAWLTNNQDKWRNTRFYVPVRAGITFFVLFLLKNQSLAILDSIHVLIKEAKHEIEMENSPHPRPGDPEYYDWANRSGKYGDDNSDHMKR